ncbi:MAG: endonuclease III [Acidobacteriota bacterium]
MPARATTKTKKSPGIGGSPELRRRTRHIIKRLRKAYPDARCALDHRNPFELLIATILSAQCTDARVNKVTPTLFARFPKASDYAAADRKELEELIRTTGFFRNKAKSIQEAARRIAEEYQGRVPETMDGMLSLPGVARKTANVVLGTALGKTTGVVVDTHVFRIAHRLGLTAGKNPNQAEKDLMEIAPSKDWVDFGHLLIHHGRALCSARQPRCEDCPVESLCPKLGVSPRRSCRSSSSPRRSRSLRQRIQSSRSRRARRPS